MLVTASSTILQPSVLLCWLRVLHDQSLRHARPHSSSRLKTLIQPLRLNHPLSTPLPSQPPITQPILSNWRWSLMYYGHALSQRCKSNPNFYSKRRHKQLPRNVLHLRTNYKVPHFPEAGRVLFLFPSSSSRLTLLSTNTATLSTHLIQLVT